MRRAGHSASRELRLGLVGCGRQAELGYVPALRWVRGARLAAVADPISARCHQLAGGLPAYESAAALVAAGGVDALVLATPASSHLADARIAAQAGLPVLMEKPPAADAAQAAALTELDPAPWVGFNRHYERGLERLRARIPSDQSLDLTLALDSPSDSRSYTVSDDVVLALGSHLIDLARWLTGCEIERVRATGLSQRAASLELALERGHARITCARGRPHRDRVEVRTSAGRLLGRYRADGVAARARRRVARPGAAHGSVRLLVHQVEAFARAARGGRAPSLATAADGLAVMTAIDSARRSTESGASWVENRPTPVAALSAA